MFFDLTQILVSFGYAALFAGRRQEAASIWRPAVALTRDSDTLRGMIELYQAIGDRETEVRARATLARVEGGR